MPTENGEPVAQDGTPVASPLAGSVADAPRTITVLSLPEGAGHGQVVRMTSANMAVLLVPSEIPVIGRPFKIWLAAGGERREKTPARSGGADLTLPSRFPYAPVAPLQPK